MDMPPDVRLEVIVIKMNLAPISNIEGGMCGPLMRKDDGNPRDKRKRQK